MGDGHVRFGARGCMARKLKLAVAFEHQRACLRERELVERKLLERGGTCGRCADSKQQREERRPNHLVAHTCAAIR